MNTQSDNKPTTAKQKTRYDYRLPRFDLFSDMHRTVPAIKQAVHNGRVFDDGLPFPLAPTSKSTFDKAIEFFGALVKRPYRALLLRADCAEIGLARAKDEITERQSLWDWYKNINNTLVARAVLDEPYIAPPQAPTPPYSPASAAYVKIRGALTGFFKPSMDYYPKG